jgi:hypothetical protein
VLYGEPGQQETGSISPLCILALQRAGARIAHLGQTDSARELPNTNTKKGEGSRLAGPVEKRRASDKIAKLVRHYRAMRQARACSRRVAEPRWPAAPAESGA